jgi:ribosomal protein L7/L12
MTSLSSLYILVLVVVVIVFLIASRSRAGRIQAARPREVPLEQRREKDEELRRLLQSGKKIEAIKNYREFYQVGLKEAKDAVEAVEKQNA